jgi:hypothetical protein
MSATVQHESSTRWRLDGRTAHLAGRDLSAVLDLAAPERGLAQLRFRGAPIDGWLLGVALGSRSDAEPDDAYVRVNDLVVVYRETSEQPFSVQVYWSVGDAAPNGVVALDATVSIQTRQWEAYPQVSIGSAVAAGERVAIDDAAVLLQPRGLDWSYAETTHRGDFALQAPSASDNLLHAAWIFGDQFMERGVIRRLRVRGALVPREGDQASLTLLRTTLQAEQPPLTA